MSLNPKQVTARPMGLSARTLVLPLVLSLAVVAIPDIAPAGIFDFLKRDRDEDVEIIETHASNCRCRPRCSHPKQSQNQHTTPQSVHRTTPQPTPQFSPKPTPQATSPYAPLATTTPIPSQAFLPPPVFQSAASPPPAPSGRPGRPWHTESSATRQLRSAPEDPEEGLPEDGPRKPSALCQPEDHPMPEVFRVFRKG